MAYTENEIYYPYDYDASADVPEDMKTMAESIDEVVGEIKSTQTSQNNRLSNLETQQISQGTRITNLETDNTTNKTNITNLQSENTRLKKNQLYGTSTGTEVEITDGAEMGASIGVSGESEQETRSGKNKFNIEDWVTKGNNSNYYSYGNGQLSINALDNRSFENFVEEDRLYLPNGNYYLSGNGSANIRIYSDSNSAVISSNNFTVTLGYIYLKLVSSNVITCKPQIEQGTVATDYEPYGVMPSPEYPSEIKNLTGNTVCTVTNANIWDEEWANGAMDASTGANQSLAQRIRSKNFISIQPNTDYYFKISNLYSNGRIAYYDKDKNYLGLTNGWRVMAFNGINTSVANAYYMKFNIEIDDSVYHNDICINKSDSSINGTYIQHQEKTVTFPFGEQKLAKGDYLASDGIHHAREQKVLDGTEEWILGGGTNTNYQRFYLRLEDCIENETGIMCNILKEVYPGSTDIFYNDVEGINISNGKWLQFKVRKTIASTVQELKSYLAEQYSNGTPVILEYELETEVVTQYTQAQQTAYNNLQNLILFEGYNHIEMISPNGVRANLTVNYTKSTGIVIQNLDERIQDLENLIMEG